MLRSLVITLHAHSLVVVPPDRINTLGGKRIAAGERPFFVSLVGEPDLESSDRVLS